MKRRRIFYPAISWLILVTILLCIPGSEFPKITWLSKLWFDKWVHVFLFAVLVIIFCSGLRYADIQRNDLRKRFLQVTVVAVLYGILMEAVQHFFIPFRSFETGDILADAGGSVAGYMYAARQWAGKRLP